MNKRFSSKAAALGFLVAVSLTMPSVSGWAAPAKKSPDASTSAAKPGHPPPHMALTAEKEKELVKEAGEAVAETKKAIAALEKNQPKEALADLDVVSGQLRTVLAKDPALKEVPVEVDTLVVDFDGDRKSVEAVAGKAGELIRHHQLQAARYLLDGLASEVRISVTTLPLETYPAAIEKAASQIVGGKIDDAKTELYGVLNLLVTRTEIYPLPLLNAEETLMEAYRLEHGTDLSKAESKKKILKLADQANEQLKLAEALGYGSKDDYPALYQGVKALKTTLHTSKFRAEWDKLQEALKAFKKKLTPPAKAK